MLDYNPRFMAETFGIHLSGVQGIWEPADLLEANLAVDQALRLVDMGQDAQPTMFTALNAGIPAWMTNFVDPEFIRVLTTPMKAAEIMGGEVLKGDWTDQTAMFPMVEAVGQTSAYGDWNNNGQVGTNNQWETRASFLFQTIASWGELEMARAGRARISYVSDLNFSLALVMNKFQNKSYFYGISAIALNYGLLNDPSLPASITPITKAAGGTTWAVATAAEIYTDIADLYAQLVTQSNGLIDKDMPLVLCMSPQDEAQLVKTNMYNVNVSDQIKKNFPNLEVISAVEYATSGGNLVQLMARTVDGQRVAMPAYND
jgi:hypothetical protein